MLLEFPGCTRFRELSRCYQISVGVAASMIFALAGISPGSATPIDWQLTFTLNDGASTISGGATLVTDSKPVGGGGFLVTDIKNGLIDGNSMTFLAPDPPNDPHGIQFSDNLVFTSNPQVDGEGLGFNAEGAEWAIFNGGSTLEWCNNSGGHVAYFCDTNSGDPLFTVKSFSLVQEARAIPEASTAALFAASLFALGLARRRVARSSSRPT